VYDYNNEEIQIQVFRNIYIPISINNEYYCQMIFEV